MFAQHDTTLAHSRFTFSVQIINLFPFSLRRAQEHRAAFSAATMRNTRQRFEISMPRTIRAAAKEAHNDSLSPRVSIQWPLLIAVVRSNGGAERKRGENTLEEKERVSCRADINSPRKKETYSQTYVQVHPRKMSFLIPS